MKFIISSALLLIVSICLAQAQTTTWTGNAGTSDWNTALNWDNGVPTITHDAVIAAAGVQPIIVANQDMQSLVIDAGATLAVNAGGLNINNQLQNQGTFLLSAAAGDVTIGTSFDNSGSFTIEAGRTLYIHHNFANTGTFTQDTNSFVVLQGTANTNG